MDKYATLYNLAPEGEYEVSFEWDDSIINDTATQLGERLTLLNAGVSSRHCLEISKNTLRLFYGLR